MRLLTKITITLLLSLAGLVVSSADLAAQSTDDKVIAVDGRNYYIYTIAAGDTYYSLSRRYGVTEQEIRDSNPRVDMLRTGETIKIPCIELPAEKKMSARFMKCSNELRTATMRVTMRQALAHPVSEFLGTAVIVIVLWFGGTLILGENSPISAAAFIYYLTILYSIINPLKELSKASYNIPRGLASMERIDAILNAENPIVDGEKGVEIPEMQEGIEYKNLTFSYDGERNVLKKINLKIQKGKTVALVGQSGSGKSTMVDLIPRYYDVEQGEITIDGVNIKDMKVKSLRGLIGNVNQEAILFNDSFYNNITFGVENATMEQVIEAAKIANAHDFIMATENGYDTNVGDRGCLLSGGQRQRISIARAILKNPPILILDEATSALDTESERLVQEALERLMKSRTTIAIAHRLSTIKNADEICVLRDGEIVERGKHEELLEQNGVYKRLNDMQSL